MAQRRMFNKVVINSARFLKMPATARLLYFDLGLRADDDGIVEAYTVMKATGSSEDDLKVLAAKGFIKVLNEDLVSYILDWTQHNIIRADRKIDSIYKNLLLQIVPDCNLIEPRARADTGKQTGRPLADNGPHRLGKDRLGKDSISKEKEKKKVYAEKVTFTEIQYNKLIKTFGEPVLKDKIEALSFYKCSKNKKYASDYHTLLSWDRSDKDKLIKEKQNKAKSIYKDL